MLSKEVVRQAVLAGLALQCQIAPQSKFDRKQYFYPDLPKGYQISQYDVPLCTAGMLLQFITSHAFPLCLTAASVKGLQPESRILPCSAVNLSVTKQGLPSTKYQGWERVSCIMRIAQGLHKD